MSIVSNLYCQMKTSYCWQYRILVGEYLSLSLCIVGHRRCGAVRGLQQQRLAQNHLQMSARRTGSSRSFLAWWEAVK